MNDIQTFLPHGYCFSWQQDLLLLHVVADSLIALAYFTIPVTLWRFVRRRTDLRFRSVFVMFGVFILACGLTHVLDVWTLWHPDFWLDGWVRAFTAAVSLATAVLLWRLVPLALALPSPDSLRQANDELRAEIERRTHYENELRIANSRMKAQIDELESLSYAISHDVRGPLRHIDGFAKALADSHPAPHGHPAQRYIERIRSSVHVLSDIVEGLLAFSRASRTEMRRERCASNAIVADVLRELVPETESRPMDIEVGPLPELEADPTLLYQVFYNLISNAVKYTRGRDPARIRIDCTGSDGRETTFRIRDNGAGFDMKYAGKLFGVFQRLHHASEFEGTGIGLANVRRIVERHGGRIWAEGTVDAGATFFFSIPVAPPADDNASSLNSNSRGASDVPAFA
jgi:light-regulated signal transduction histidine kinase (bacteriophytochrome)